MAFNRAELSCLGTTGAGTSINHLYFYANTADDDTTVANFFDAAADQINTGDILFVIESTAPRLQFLINTAGVISLGDLDVTTA